MKLKLLIIFFFISTAAMAQTGNDTTKYFTSKDYGWLWQRGKFRQLIAPNDTVNNKQGVAVKAGTWYYGNGTYWASMGSTFDTASLSTRINARVKYTDTAAMIAPYLRSNVAAATYATIAGLALKLNISDTAAMLSPYIRSNVAAATYATTTNLALKLNITDTAAMLTNYLRSGTAASTYLPLAGGTMTGDILPSSDNVRSFGSSSLRFNTLYTPRINSGADNMLLTAAGFISIRPGSSEKWQITSTGAVLATTDNAYDIGASGATRPRTGYFGTSIFSPTVDGTTYVRTATLYGPSGAGSKLTISSSSNGTKGKILFGTSGYDETNNYLGIGTTSPGALLDINAASGANAIKIGSGIKLIQYSDNELTFNVAGVNSLKARSNAVLTDLPFQFGSAADAPQISYTGNNIYFKRVNGTYCNIGIGITSPTKLLQVGTVDPVLSMKQTTTAQQFDMRVGVGTGISNSNWNLYDATAGKIRLAFSGYRMIVGNLTSAYASSVIYAQGNTAGANIDAQADSTVNDNGNIEVMKSDYTNGEGIALRGWGNVGTPGTYTMGFLNKNLGVLDFNNSTNLIRVTNNRSLWFGTNNTPGGVLDSLQRWGFGTNAPLPTKTVEVNGTFSTTGVATFGAQITLKGYTVATLPAGTIGQVAYVTDALAPSYLVAVVGGGTVVTPVFYNGSAWVAQ